MKLKRPNYSVRATNRLLLIVSLLVCAGPLHGQANPSVVRPERAFRSAATAQLNAAAKKSRVALAQVPIAYAGGDGGFVLNAVVANADRLNAESLAAGTDVFVMYMGGQQFAVPEGFYKVNVRGREARFISAAGKTVATLPIRIENAGQPAARAKVKVRVTASWGKNGPEVDIEITFGETASTALVIEIPDKTIATAAQK